MIAAHLGVVEEERINDMSYVFFDDVLQEQGYKLNYEAVAHYAGNSFCERSWDMIQRSNPFNVAETRGESRSMGNLASFLESSKITIMGGNDSHEHQAGTI